MMNFKDYINNDINEKKVLIDLLPKNTYKRKEKYHDTVVEIKNKYLNTKEDVKKYIDYKYNKLLPKKTTKKIDNESEEIIKLQELLVLGNPLSSFFEKMKFDLLLYDLMHYYDNSLDNVNDAIYKFIKKIKDAGINISPNDFKTNIHVYLYTKVIFDKYFLQSKHVLNDEFEKIYWKCPKVIEYIIINLLMIIRKNEKKLINYVNSKYKLKLKINDFKNYDEIIVKIKSLKNDIEEKLSEDEYDIVNLCLEGKLDLNSIVTSKENDYNFFMIRQIDLSNKKSLDKFINSVITLKYGLEEYLVFLEYQKVITEFKDKYKKFVTEKEQKSNNLKQKISEITKLEKKLSTFKINKYTNNLKELENSLTDKEMDKIFKQEVLLDQIYKLYIELNGIYFDDKIKSFIKVNTSVSDILELYEAFPFFAKRMIKKVFEVEDDLEINELLTKMSEFIYNPHRKIIDMIPVFMDKNVPQLLTNGYRFENLNITEESFEDDNINNIFEKCNKIIRGIKIEKFNLTIEEINFLVKIAELKGRNII